MHPPGRSPFTRDKYRFGTKLIYRCTLRPRAPHQGTQICTISTRVFVFRSFLVRGGGGRNTSYISVTEDAFLGPFFFRFCNTPELKRDTPKKLRKSKK